MSKFLKIFEVSVLNRFEYRLNSFMWLLYSFIPTLASMAVWNTVYRERSYNAFGYTNNEMITYYFIMLIVSNLLKAGYDYHGVADSIKYGSINQFLVRPYDFMKYKFIYSLPENVIFIFVGIIPLIVLGVILRSSITLEFNYSIVIFFVIALVLGYLIQFLILFSLSTCAFFMHSITSLFMTLDILKNIVSGQVFPLSILPKPIFKILQYSPFQYLAFYPVGILQGRYEQKEMVMQSLVGFLWILILFIFS